MKGRPYATEGKHPMRRAAVPLALAAALLAVSGCGGEDSAAEDEPTSVASQPTTPEPESEPEPEGGGGNKPPDEPADDAVVVDVTIEGGEVSPAGEQVEATVGQPIELRVDSDTDEELHVHSTPEHTFDVQPTDGQVFELEIERPGQVEVEAHGSGTLIVELVVQP